MRAADDDPRRRDQGLLHAQAKRLNRPEYLLTANVPLTPELSLECGLDTAAWDAETLVDCIAVGTYQAYMNHPMERWKKSAEAWHAGLCLCQRFSANGSISRA